MGSTAAEDRLDAEAAAAAAAGRNLEWDIGCSPEADCIGDHRKHCTVLTF